MSEIPFISYQNLLEMGQLDQIGRALLEHEIMSGYVNAEELRTDPFGALDQHPNLEIRYEEQTVDTCSVAGYFDAYSDPPKLVVHPSGAYRRDAFTVLHEYGHFVQMTNSEWSDLLLMLAPSSQHKTEEEIADAFAAYVLFPHALSSLDALKITARDLRDLFEQHPTASRSAIAYRTISQLSATDDLMVSVISDWGNDVIFARSSGEIMSPGRGVYQPTIRRIALSAKESSTLVGRGNSNDVLVARSGSKQTKLKIEVAVDPEGYGFVVARRAQKFGTLSWARPSRLQCSNPACDEWFEIHETSSRCSKCDDWCCPECNECTCEISSRDLCYRCGMQMSPGERAGIAEHECIV